MPSRRERQPAKRPKKTKAKTGKKKSRPDRIGPTGDDVDVDWFDHGAARTVERVVSATGCSIQKIRELLRNPNHRRKDRRDEKHPARFHRCILLPVGDKKHKFNFVCMIQRHRSKGDPGAIAVISAWDLDAN